MASSINPVAQSLLYLVVGLVAQTLFFGVYTVIIFLSSRMLMRRGLKNRANRVLFIITLFMYLLSAAYWAYRLADLMSRMLFHFENPLDGKVSTPITTLLGFFNALTLINYVLCDGVVIWRARLICTPDHRKYLYLPLFFLGLTSVAVAGIIGLRITALYKTGFAKTAFSTMAINSLQVSAICMSIISNLSSTGVVGITAWFVSLFRGTQISDCFRRHREAIRVFRNTTKGAQILRILLESGVLYCILVGLVSTLIRLPYNTLGDIYTPVNIQIAGAYAPIVLLLVRTQKSLSETSFLATIPVDLDSPEVNHIASNRTISVSESMVVLSRTPELVDKEYEKGHRFHPSNDTLV
ncbi:hypothetical protein C8R47DRAFT_971244 [Mycena vitilis]|nr:hypothetical protein C8R47DRAFT_971244 [Mycena vitilis]